MSNSLHGESSEFLKRYYQNSNVTEQIRDIYGNNANHNKMCNSDKLDSPCYAKLNSQIETLTYHMKNVLNNSTNTNNANILNESENEDFERQLTKGEKSFISHSFRNKLVETDAQDLTIIQFDSKDPLYSVSSFEDLKLSAELLNGICSMHFRKPSAIQEKALPLLLDPKPRNLIAQSQSGTGKTATFLLTMLSKIDINDKFCQCLCMAPTRELATQIAEVAVNMSKFMNKIKICCAIKESCYSAFRGNVSNGEIESQIVIGTPGTLKFWTAENSSLFLDPKRLKVFVLDEADVLIENPEFLNIAKRIKSKVTSDCQILLFSATYDERVMEFAHEFVPNPTEFNVKPQELTLKNIKQFYIKMQNIEEKYPTLIDIYGKKSMGQCIIFCESRRMADHLQKNLEKDSYLSSLLSGDLDIPRRQKEIQDFRVGKSRVLIATNLCSRGIDIPQVNLIINWDMPKTKDNQPDCETYLHRIGRSGRFGKTGLTINFIASDFDLQIQEKIIQVYGGKIEEMKDLNIVTNI